MSIVLLRTGVCVSNPTYTVVDRAAKKMAADGQLDAFFKLSARCRGSYRQLSAEEKNALKKNGLMNYHDECIPEGVAAAVIAFTKRAKKQGYSIVDPIQPS